MAEFVPVEPFDIVIFGVSGDLSKVKLLPALFHRFADGQIDPSSHIIGTSRSNLTHDEFILMVREACLAANQNDIDEAKWSAFVPLLSYHQIDATAYSPDWHALVAQVNEGNSTLIHYLAVAPKLYVQICESLQNAGLVSDNTRVVLEKPIGVDLPSAQRINQGVGAVFPEHAIFRMDHYLGKETVQNLLVLRFANTLFEPLWSSHAIDHVQITVAESLGTEGRDAYYDGSGAMRDIVQNHILQLLCLIAMEPPNALDADSVRIEKIKVLKALEAFDATNISTNTVRAQYKRGMVDGAPVPGYKETLPEELKSSTTETFVAIKTEVKNWRWAGVPFYLRTGKRMADRRSEIIIQFKATPHNLFGEGSNEPNRLVLRLQPDEGMRLYMQVKEPGPGRLKLRSLPLDLSYARSFSTVNYPDAYERLLMDVARGNLALFMSQDEVEAAWEWTDNILKAWQDADQSLHDYAAGTDGPLQSAMLLDRDGRSWHDGD